MIVDSRKEKSPVAPLQISGSPIEIVDSFQFLGTIIFSGLDWETNTNSTPKKMQKGMYFLRQLKRFGLRREILIQFYRAVIESVLCFSLPVWRGSTTQDQKRRVNRDIRKAGRIVGRLLPSTFTKRSVARSRRITADRSHPAHDLFQLLPSGRRYRALRARTTRLCHSFFHRLPPSRPGQTGCVCVCLCVCVCVRACVRTCVRACV